VTTVDERAAQIIANVNAICQRAIAETAYEDIGEILDSNRAELVAIGARIRDWRNLNKRVEFLTMVAERITFASVLRNEGIVLALTDDEKFKVVSGKMTDEIKQWIQDNRPAIVAELRREK
jgi:hypothetical protein